MWTDLFCVQLNPDVSDQWFNDAYIWYCYLSAQLKLAAIIHTNARHIKCITLVLIHVQYDISDSNILTWRTHLWLCSNVLPVILFCGDARIFFNQGIDQWTRSKVSGVWVCGVQGQSPWSLDQGGLPTWNQSFRAYEHQMEMATAPTSLLFHARAWNYQGIFRPEGFTIMANAPV